MDLIIDKVKQGMLFPLYPRARGASPKRVLLIAENLRKFIDSPGPDPDWEDRKGELEADLDVFASGQPIGPKYLFLLYHSLEGVWEIRSVRPNPSIRVLGRFIEKDIFVATNFALRSDLGGWQSRQWRDVKVMSRTIWTNLFHTHQPLITTDVHRVVTGAIDGKYFKGS